MEIYNKNGIYNLAMSLIYSAVIKDETEFLFSSDFGSNMLWFAEHVSGYSFEAMKRMILEHYNSLKVKGRQLINETGNLTLKEISEKYNVSQQKARYLCLRQNVDFKKVKHSKEEAMDLLEEKLRALNGKYTIYEMSLITKRNTSDVRELCQARDIPYRVA